MDKQISLTKDQINQLFEFTKKKYVKHEDVKFEIVDHLASDIEAQMSEGPDIDFETALKITYSKFPITGFTQFVTNKTSALKKYWRKKLFSLILGYFKLPKLILTSMIAIAYLLVKTNLSSVIIAYSIGSVLFVYALFIVFKLKKEHKSKSYLITQTYFETLGPFMMWTIYYNFYFADQFLNDSLYLDTVLFTLSCIILIAISSGEVRQLLESELNEKYQHLGLVGYR